MSRDYKIADIRIRFHEPCADIAAAGVKSFHKFQAEHDPTAECAAEFHLDRELHTEDFEIELLHTFDFPDANHDCFFGRYPQGRIFYMRPQGREDSAADTIFIMPSDSRTVESNIAFGKEPDPSLLRFGLWMCFGVAISGMQAAAVHSSVIVKDGVAVMFLGESGTGKSTHTRLWRENIEGAKLLNDDSPIVRIIDGKAIVYGSPWSGKTPCYIDKGFPIKGIVRLSQAPHNKIRKLSLLESFGAIYPSCPPSFAYDDKLQDNVCEMLSELLSTVSVWHLGCLPDADAAKLSYSTIFAD